MTSIKIPFNWQINPPNNEVLLAEINQMEKSSQTNTSAQLEGGLIESLLRIYLRSTPFSPYFIPDEWFRNELNDYEFDELFFVQKPITLEDVLKLANGGNFSETFELAYEDTQASALETEDILMAEAKRNLTEQKFQEIYTEILNKIEKVYLSIYLTKDAPKIKKAHVFIFFNGVKIAFNEKFGVTTKKMKCDNKDLDIFFYCIHVKKEKLFSNMTGRSSWTTQDFIKEFKKNTELLAKVDELEKTNATLAREHVIEELFVNLINHFFIFLLFRCPGAKVVKIKGNWDKEKLKLTQDPMDKFFIV